MWTRAELKDYAKGFLRKHYWKAFIVCLIFTILTGSGNSGGSNDSNNYNYDSTPSYEYYLETDQDNIIYNTGSNGLRELIRSMGFFPAFFIGSTIFTFALILWVISLFIGPLITVGKNRFFLNGFQEDVSIRYLFSAFNRDEFWGIFKCIFITNIKNFLWFLLLIIPGIIKAFEYSMVPYILTNNTNLTSAEAIKISRELTYGHKFDMFVLILSFIGWYLLGSLFFGIGVFFVNPYYEATKARLYLVLSGNDYEPNNESEIVYE